MKPANASELLHQGARRLLRHLYDSLYVVDGDRSSDFAIDELSREQLSSLDLTVDEATRALNVLETKRLVAAASLNSVELTELAVEAVENTDVLDRLLPIAPRVRADVSIVVDGGFAIDEIERHLAFMRDADVRTLLARDIGELGQALDHGMTKSAVLLCGTILEAVLLEVVGRNRALAASHRPRKKAFPDDFALSDFLDIAIEEGVVPPGVRGMATAVIDHRDLIHPAAERRRHTRSDAARAGAMASFLRVVLHDLNLAATDGTLAAYETK